MSILSNPIFHNEQAAFDFVESRVWRDGVVCPHCGKVHNGKKMGGKATRIGLYKCYGCRKQFTVKIGTVFEQSHVKMNIWLQAIYLMTSSKKGISSNQLHRTLGVTLKTAWFMSHRIREAMRSGNLEPMGGNGGIFEADETFIGTSADKPANARAYHHKQKVFSLIERQGKVRSFRVDNVRAKTLVPIIKKNLKKEVAVFTDEAKQYNKLGEHFHTHDSVCHSKDEYVRGVVHTNTIESYFSVFKRGMKGTYQHCAEKHLHRYLAEFDFRHNNRIALKVDDKQRFENVFDGVMGKRLTYRRIDCA